MSKTRKLKNIISDFVSSRPGYQQHYGVEKNPCNEIPLPETKDDTEPQEPDAPDWKMEQPLPDWATSAKVNYYPYPSKKEEPDGMDDAPLEDEDYPFNAEEALDKLIAEAEDQAKAEAQPQPFIDDMPLKEEAQYYIQGKVMTEQQLRDSDDFTLEQKNQALDMILEIKLKRAKAKLENAKPQFKGSGTVKATKPEGSYDAYGMWGKNTYDDNYTSYYSGNRRSSVANSSVEHKANKEESYVNIEELADHYAQKDLQQLHPGDKLEDHVDLYKTLLAEHTKIINTFKRTNNE